MPTGRVLSLSPTVRAAAPPQERSVCAMDMDKGIRTRVQKHFWMILCHPERGVAELISLKRITCFTLCCFTLGGRARIN